MSTRCLYGFKKNGMLKLTYNHSDSYPTGFGKDIVLFIRENTLEELNEICDSIKLVKRHDFPNNDEISEMIKLNIYYREDNKILDWENIFWSNSTFLNYYKKGFYMMPDFSEFSTDYVYIINLDNNKFEVIKYGKLKKSFDVEKIPRDWDILLDDESLL